MTVETCDVLTICSLQYRKSNGLYYWYGCSDFSTTWVYTATDSKQVVYPENGRYLEGARFYQIGDYYYIWVTKPADE
jgi:hypothetical protein